MKHARAYRQLLVLGLLFQATRAPAQPGGHGVHPPMPTERFLFQCKLDGGQQPIAIEVPLELPTPMTPAKLDQTVELPSPLGSIRILHYLPTGRRQQTVVPDESADAKPAIEILIEGPTQSFDRWLVADNSERNRLSSLIGTWRYMVVADRRERDELFDQFKGELTRPPKLIISRSDGSDVQEVLVEDGKSHRLDSLGCKVHVGRFYPHFSMDKKTNEAVNLSDERRNPAVQVRLEREDQKEDRWVFAKFPDFQAGGSESLPYRLTLDCPPAKGQTTPDFALVTIGRSIHEAWTRHANKCSSAPLRLGKKMDVPGSQYAFSARRFVASARLEETYRPAEGRGGAPALKIEIIDGTGRATILWLESGRRRIFSTPQGPLTVAFSPDRTSVSGKHSWSG
jgi:hypothetical protein